MTLNDQVKGVVERELIVAQIEELPGLHPEKVKGLIRIVDRVANLILTLCREDAQRREEEAVLWALRWACGAPDPSKPDVDCEEGAQEGLAAYKSHKVSESDTIRSRKDQELRSMILEKFYEHWDGESGHVGESLGIALHNAFRSRKE